MHNGYYYMHEGDRSKFIHYCLYSFNNINLKLLLELIEKFPAKI